jgi:hypothetical protein
LWESFIRHTKTLFLNYEKIITARIYARGNDDVDNKTSDKITRKWGTGQTEQPLISEHPGYSPKLKSHVLNQSDPLHQYWTSQKSHHKTPTNNAEESGKVDVHLPFLE